MTHKVIYLHEGGADDGMPRFMTEVIYAAQTRATNSEILLRAFQTLPNNCVLISPHRILKHVHVSTYTLYRHLRKAGFVKRAAGVWVRSYQNMSDAQSTAADFHRRR